MGEPRPACSSVETDHSLDTVTLYIAVHSLQTFIVQLSVPCHMVYLLFLTSSVWLTFMAVTRWKRYFYLLKI